MKELMVSIIIPAYNCGLYIEKCIESWRLQSYKEWEIIIVDDGSTDDTLSKCNNIAMIDERIKVVHTENSGVSHARNVALDYAVGDIIGFCDSDDYVDASLLEKIVNAYMQERTDIVVIGYKYYYQNTESVVEFRKDRQEVCTAKELAENMFFEESTKGFVWNKFFSSKIARDIKFNEDLVYCEDFQWIMQILVKNMEAKTVYIPYALYNYVVRDTSATQNMNIYLDKMGQSRYVTAFEEILKLCIHAPKIEEQCISNLFYFSVNNFFCATHMDSRIRTKLSSNIKKYKWIYLKNKNRSLNERIRVLIRLIRLRFMKIYYK